MQYSVLMSVYAKEKPEYLRKAMNSMWAQTVKTDDFVLVCDGPLTDGLNEVIRAAEEAHPELHTIRLAKNEGLGRALNAGMKHCRHGLIARMDSDDLSRPDRCERQLKAFQSHPEISVCSGTVEEFITSPDVIESSRVLPETQRDILRFAKKRNPFNHPCVMINKAAVEAAGGFQDFYLLEDYYLWVRMLQKGFSGYNLKQPLLWMRIGSGMYKRRAGWNYAKSQKALFRYMRDTGFISSPQYAASAAVRSASAMMPNHLRVLLFRKVLRNRRKHDDESN